MTTARERAREAVNNQTCWRSLDNESCACCSDNNEKADAASDVWELFIRLCIQALEEGPCDSENDWELIDSVLKIAKEALGES